MNLGTSQSVACFDDNVPLACQPEQQDVARADVLEVQGAAWHKFDSRTSHKLADAVGIH
jgi:hypothetical protein